MALKKCTQSKRNVIRPRFTIQKYTPVAKGGENCKSGKRLKAHQGNP